MSSILEEFVKNQEESEIKTNFDLKYMGLGIGGEVGEILNEIKKIERDDDNKITTQRKQKLILELGDVMWYLQGICKRLNVTIEEVLQANITKLKIGIRIRIIVKNNDYKQKKSKKIKKILIIKN